MPGRTRSSTRSTGIPTRSVAPEWMVKSTRMMTSYLRASEYWGKSRAAAFGENADGNRRWK